MTPEEFSTLLREYREKHGLSKQELAHRLGVAPSSLSAWEKRPMLPMKLAVRGILETLTNGNRLHAAAHEFSGESMRVLRKQLGSNTRDTADAIGMTREKLNDFERGVRGLAGFASKVGILAELDDYKRHIKEALEWDDSYAYINTVNAEPATAPPRAPSESEADGGSAFDFAEDLPALGVREG